MSGDFYQLKPVLDVSEGIKYDANAALHYLVDGYKFELTECRRFQVQKNLLFDEYGDELQRFVDMFPVLKETYVNLVKYHRTRIRVNQECQGRFIDGKHTSPTICENRNLPRSQNVVLCVDYPLISRENEGVFYKNSFWKVTGIHDDYFTAIKVALEHEKNEEQPTIELKYERFHRYFEPGFAMTTHSSQSLTIREPYTIHDADYMGNRILYVALGRASSKDIVQIESQHATRFPLNYCFKSVAGKTFQEAAKDEAFCDWINNKVCEFETIPDTVLSQQLIKFVMYIQPGEEDEACNEEEYYAYSESEEEEEEPANIPLDHPAASFSEPMQVEQSLKRKRIEDSKQSDNQSKQHVLDFDDRFQSNRNGPKIPDFKDVDWQKRRSDSKGNPRCGCGYGTYCPDCRDL